MLPRQLAMEVGIFAGNELAGDKAMHSIQKRSFKRDHVLLTSPPVRISSGGRESSCEVSLDFVMYVAFRVLFCLFWLRCSFVSVSLNN